MANTVNILGFANTFGDWIVATNADSNEINSIGKYDWTKDSGTLILNGAGTSLTVGNNAIIVGQLQVTGTSSSATIDNNLTVGKQVYFTNTTQSLVASGTVTSNGTIFATNTGTSLSVSNNSTLGGTLTVSGTTTISNTINVLGAATLQNSLSVGAGALITGNVSITGNTYTSFLTANNRLNTGQLTVTSNGNFGGSIVVTSSAVVNGYDIISYILGAFTQANSAYGSQNVTGTYANSAYLAANSASLYANGAFVQANAAYVSQNTTGTYANSAFLFANNLQSGAQTHNNMTLTGTSLTATNAIGAFQSLTTSGSVTVGGSFVLNGTVIYTTNNFVINANTNTPIISYFSVNRGTANNQPNGIPNANASIRWNESSKYWDIVDVNNGTQYSQIMTANMISDSTTSTSTATVPTNKVLTGAFIQANAAYGAANTAALSAAPAFIQANGAFSQANAAFTFANSSSSTLSSSITAAGSYANSAFTTANVAYVNAQTADSKAVTSGSYANSAFTTANNALPKTGGTLSGDLGITGNLFVNGTSSYINVSTFQTVDSLIELAANNLSDTIDIGFYGQYASVGTKYTGLVRTAGSSYFLFQGITSNPTSNSVGTITYANYGTLNANIAAGQITSSQPLPVTSGGTGVTTSTGSGSVVLSTSPTLTTPILGTPQSGNLSNCTFPTLNQNTTGTAAGLSGSPNITVGDIQSNRAGTPTQGIVFLGNAGTHYLFWDGTNYVMPNANLYVNGVQAVTNSGTWAINISGSAASLSATLAVGSGGTGVTTSTGSGSNVLSTSPTLTTPILGTPTSGNLANCTFPTLNQNTTGTAYNITQYSINQNLSTTSGVTFDSVSTAGTVSAVTVPGAGRGLCVRAPAGDASSAILQFTNNAVSAQWGAISTPSSGVMNISASSGLTCDGNITAYSDVRIKTNITKIGDALNKVGQLNGYTFDRTDTETARQTGVIAQEVLKVLPEAVTELNDENKTLTVAYGNMMGLMIEAIKELREQVEELKAKLP